MVDLRRDDAGLVEAGQFLAARLGAAVEPPASVRVDLWLEGLVGSLPMSACLAIVEHFFGVLPLAAEHLGSQPGGTELVEALRQGHKLAGLGLFTPDPEFSPSAAALVGEFVEGGVSLRGEVRLANSSSDGSLVLVRCAEDDLCLAWLEHSAMGVERRRTRAGGPVSESTVSESTLPESTLPEDTVCWVAVADAFAAPISGPVTFEVEGPVARRLDACAGVIAFVESLYAGRLVRAMRRAVRITASGAVPFNTSQLVALDVTGLEIETGLAETAARACFRLDPGDGSRPRGLTLAAAAAKVLTEAVAMAARLRDQWGVEVDDAALANPEAAAASVNAFFGGPLRLESELARAMDLSARRPGVEEESA